MLSHSKKQIYSARLEDIIFHRIPANDIRIYQALKNADASKNM